MYNNIINSHHKILCHPLNSIFFFNIQYNNLHRNIKIDHIDDVIVHSEVYANSYPKYALCFENPLLPISGGNSGCKLKPN